MDSSKLFIPILLGTARKGRQSEHVANYLLGEVENHTEIETRLFDPAEMILSCKDEGGDLKEQNSEWRDAIIRADGLIIVSPEYNHGYPGSLKMALDILLKEYVHKAVGLVGVSSGGFAGTRMVEQLVGVVRELGLAVTFEDLYFPHVQDAFDENGNPKDEKTAERVAGFLEELVWMSKALRWGRENLPSKFT